MPFQITAYPFYIKRLEKTQVNYRWKRQTGLEGGFAGLESQGNRRTIG